MKFGWCVPLQHAAVAAECGIDFIEVAVAPFRLEEPGRLEDAKRTIEACPIPTPAFNVFLPRDMHLVGEAVDEDRVRTYFGRAADLLAHAGAKIVVLGSGWARTVPDGFERARGEAQFTEALHWAADSLQGTGCVLAIEPLNRREANLINSVAEGVRFAEAVSRPEVRVLADFYHMEEEGEPLSEVAAHVGWLAHVHLADTARTSPGTGQYDYPAFFGHLKRAGYQGLLSAECSVQDAAAELRASADFVRARWEEAA